MEDTAEVIEVSIEDQYPNGYYSSACPEGGAHDFTNSDGGFYRAGDLDFRCDKCTGIVRVWDGRVGRGLSKGFSFPRRAKSKEEALTRMAKEKDTGSTWSLDTDYVLPEWSGQHSHFSKGK